MSCVINFSTLINHVTNKNRFFMKDMKLPVTCHQKKDMNHFIYLNSKYPGIRRPSVMLSGEGNAGERSKTTIKV